MPSKCLTLFGATIIFRLVYLRKPSVHNGNPSVRKGFLIELKTTLKLVLDIFCAPWASPWEAANVLWLCVKHYFESLYQPKCVLPKQQTCLIRLSAAKVLLLWLTLSIVLEVSHIYYWTTNSCIAVHFMWRVCCLSSHPGSNAECYCYRTCVR